MLTDYHLHLRPDEDGTTVGALLHRRERRPLPRRRRGGRDRGARRLRARLPLPPGARPLAPPALGRERPSTTSTPTASSSAARRCGSGSSATSSPAPRSAPRRCSRRATSTTSSARSTSSARRRAVDHDGFDVWEGGGDADEVWRRYFEALAECARSGLFDILAHPDLVKVWGGARPLPERDPRHFYEPAVEAIAESGIAVEVSTAGLRKPVGELYPAPRLRRDVRRGRRRLRPLLRRPPARAGRLRLRPRARASSTSSGSSEICVFERRQRRLAPLGAAGVGLSDEVGIGYDSHRFAEGRPPGPRRGRDRARPRASPATPTPTSSPTR